MLSFAVIFLCAAVALDCIIYTPESLLPVLQAIAFFCSGTVWDSILQMSYVLVCLPTVVFLTAAHHHFTQILICILINMYATNIQCEMF